MERLGGKFVYLDPDEPMVGRCLVCHTAVKTIRSKTFIDSKTQANAALGLWVEIPYVECLECRRRSQELITKAGTSKKAIGTRVYVGVAHKK